MSTRIAVLRVLLISLVLCGSTAARAEGLDHIRQTGELELCANPAQMPFSSRAEEPQGFQIDLARALADKLGVALNIAWIRYRHEAKRTSCDFYAGVASLPDRESRYLRLTDPFMRLETMLVTRADASGRIERRDDLRGRVVGVASGSLAAHQLARQGVELAVRFPDEASRLQAVADGVIDAAVVSQVAAGWFNRRSGQALAVQDAEQLLGIALNYDYALGLRRSDAGSQAEFNRLLVSMRQDGSLQALLASYGLSHD